MAKDKLDNALDRLYEAMKSGDIERLQNEEPLIWGDPYWWMTQPGRYKKG